jgi:signal recognition particle subunit SEC65
MEIRYIQSVSNKDIREVETELGITLTNEQRLRVWREYNRIVLDRAEDWNELIKEIIKQI